MVKEQEKRNARYGKLGFILGAMVLVYLFAVELAKRGFYRWSAARGRRKTKGGGNDRG